MVYKRYIKRGGKVCGPYYYESYRDKDGKVVSKYLKNYKPKFRDKVSYKTLLTLAFVFLAILLLILFINFGYIFNKSGIYINYVNRLFSGNVVSEQVVEEFNTQTADLTLKEPVKTEILKEQTTKNKNKRMDFSLKEGNVRLYFDLLNYSEFVENVGETISENISSANTINAVNNVSSENTAVNQSNQSSITNKENDINNQTSIINEHEPSENQTIQSNETSGITGNAVNANENSESQTVQININDIKQKIEELKAENESKIEEIAGNSVIPAENFDIIVNETASSALNTNKSKNMPDYKWGYKVKLKDLKFMAKIEVTTNQTISIYNEHTLKIGRRNLLSFEDLIKAGYKVRIEIPTLAIPVNVSFNITIPENATTIINETVNETGNIINETENQTLSENQTVGINNQTLSENQTLNENQTIGINNQTLNENQSSSENQTHSGEINNQTAGESMPVINESENQINISVIITGNIMRFFSFTGRNIIGFVGFVGRVVLGTGTGIRTVENIQYSNTITVYIERDFTNISNVMQDVGGGVSNISGEKITSSVDYEDLDGDGKISIGDVIELDPTLTIIPATDAEHLDSSRNFISDIYDYVKTKDNNWSETIPVNDFVRVTFKQNLTNKNDITVYARSLYGSSDIGVYKQDSDTEIAKFINVTSENWHKIYLTNLSENDSYDAYDLKILNNSVEFDYIVDPTAGATNVSGCTILSTAGTYYQLNASISNDSVSGNGCIIVSAQNITFDCDGYSITSATNTSGVYTDKYNTTVKNCNISMGSGGNADSIGIEYVAGANNGTIFNNSVVGNVTYGVYLSSNYNNASNNYIYLNRGRVGIAILGGTGNNTFINNNVSVYDSYDTVQAGITMISSNSNGNTLINNYFYSNKSTSYSGAIRIGGNNNILINNTGIGNSDNGIKIAGNNNILINNTGISTSNQAMVLDTSNNNTLTGNIVISNSNNGLHGYPLGVNNTFTGNTFKSNTGYGMYLRGPSSDNNIFIGNNFSSNSSYAIYLLVSALNNRFVNTRAEGYKAGSYGVYIHITTSNNTFQDCVNISGVDGDVKVADDADYNNTFINCSYTLSKESVAAGSTLIRKWWYIANVTDTNNIPVVANITATNSSGNLEFSMFTNPTGLSSLTAITDYVNNGGTRKYYSNYTVNATNLFCTPSLVNHIFNSSLGNNYNDKFIFTACTTFPQINFTAPTPSNGTTTTNTSIVVNVSIVKGSNEINEVNYNWNGTNYTMYNDSLVLMMNFENLSSLGENSTYVVDVSKYGNNGTVSGAVVNSSSGKYGWGTYFNGSENNYINITNADNSLKLINSDATFSAWIKPNSIISFDGIIGNNFASGWWFSLYVGRASIWVNTTGELHSGNTAVSIGQWNYIVVSYNSSGKNATFYKDGVIDGSAITTYNIADGGNTFYIGQDGRNGQGLPFDGSIDEIRIWNRSLSDSEVYQQYVSNLQKYNQTQWYLYVNQSKNATTGLDLGIYNYLGTYNYFASIKDTAGIENMSETRYVTIQGADIIYPQFSNYLDNNASLLGGGTGWFNVTVDNTNGTVLLEINNINYTASNLTANVYNVSVSFTQNETYSYKWHSWGNGTSNNYNVSNTRSYVVNVTSYPQINFTAPTPSNGTTTANTSVVVNVSIVEQNLNSVNYNWNGTNYTMYNDSLVLMYNFENLSSLGENSTYVADVSNYGNNGTVNGAVINSSSGKYGWGAWFNGINSNISLPTTVNFSNFNSWTISGWIYSAGNKYKNSPFFGDLASGSAPACRFTVDVDSLLICYASDGTDFYISGIQSTTVIHPGKWHHIVLTYNSTWSYLYVDGVQEGSYDALDNRKSTQTNPIIGGGASGSALNWNGSIDEVRIWNRSLSADEVYEMYASNLQKYNSTQWYLYVNQSKNATTGLDLGTYNYFASAKNNVGDENVSETRYVTIQAPDITYPQFSNYLDNNASLAGSGIAWFNVTVENTNGTVYLNINGISLLATNLTSNVYNASYTFAGGGTYPYNWTAYGNGTSNNLNTSNIRNYTINESSYLNIESFYQYPLNVIAGEKVYSYCTANSSSNSSNQLNVTLQYKNNASSIWLSSTAAYNPRKIIWSIGDSITKGSVLYTPGQPANDTNPVNNSYQYWLDYYMNSNASGLDGSGLGVYNQGAGSDTCSNMANRFKTDIGNNSIVILMCGINDFSLGKNYSQVEGYVISIYNNATAKNDTLIIMEIIPDGNGNFCSNITPYNAWLNSYWEGNPNVTIVKTHSSMSNGTDCYYNSSLYYADQVHPNLAGYKVIGNTIWKTLNEQYYNNWMANITVPSDEVNSSYDFNCNVSDLVLSNYSVNYKSVNVTQANQTNPPQIIYVSPISATDPVAGANKSIVFYATAKDNNGVSYLNDSSFSARFNMTGEATRSGTCSLVNDIDALSANYSCIVNMWYWDSNGVWNVNVTGKDNLGNSATNISTNFTYNLLKEMLISPLTITWPSISPNATNQTSNNDPTIVNNTGNFNGTIYMIGIDLYGQTDANYAIHAENFTVGIVTGAGNPECSGIVNQSTQLANNTQVTITGSSANRGNLSLNGGAGQQNLSYCIARVPSNLSSQTYSTTAGGSWTIGY